MPALSQDTNWTNIYTPIRIRAAFVDWQSAGGWSHAITLNINRRGVSVRGAKSMISLFCRRVDQYRFKRRDVNKILSDDRFSAVALIEHPESNIHVHMAAKLDSWLEAPLSDTDKLHFEELWRQCTRGSGTLFFKEISNPRGWLTYITKDFHKTMSWMLASDFHPR